MSSDSVGTTRGSFFRRNRAGGGGRNHSRFGSVFCGFSMVDAIGAHGKFERNCSLPNVTLSTTTATVASTVALPNASTSTITSTNDLKPACAGGTLCEELQWSNKYDFYNRKYFMNYEVV